MKKGIIPVFKRELHRMTSRPIYIMMTIVIPLLTILFFTTFLNQGMPRDLKIAVVDLDNSSTSRLIIRQIDAGSACEIAYRVSSYNEAKSLMQSGKIYAFVYIPKNFNKDLVNGNNPDIIFYNQYANYLSNSLIMKDVNTILATISAGVNLKTRLAKGQTRKEAMASIQPIVIDTHTIGNPYLNYSYYLTSIMVPGILFLMAMISTIYAIGVELKFGLSLRWLALSNRSMFKALLGKLLPYNLIYSALLIVYYIIMERIFGFEIKGNLFIMVLGGVFSIASYQAIGIFIMGVLPVLRDALSISAFYGMLGFAFAGFTYPVFVMQPAAKLYTFLYPLTQYYNLYSKVQINGLGFIDAWQPFAFFAFYMLIPLLVIKRLMSACVKLNYSRE